ncbi:hypothetical protein CYQ88_10850 [Hydrogenovibrio sp. SC-1]|uniref:ATP-binding protein n=1 Tax=Hydrogenovibrio sp. SC-1 TaxID=2065820 RepID=UPI000C7BD25F|nr:ATP-binding protein [Hydrogenovibrio sp. SC-1]PLA73513.1 hypothetical protein CYQ88_10850 [Hydrogenovibrio sp. SC-1]
MSLKVDTSLKAKITIVTGSSGSGKSAWVKQQITKATRLAVWDVDDEYGDIRGIKTFYNVNELAGALRRSKVGKFRLVGEFGDFDLFCKIVFAWGVCTCVIEELAGVTTPAKAPKNWHTLVSRGRKRGITIYAITQRPSESDKTIMGNASTFHAGRMNRQQDRVYMAKEMDIPVSDIANLKPLEFIEKYDDGTKTAGIVRFGRKKSA